MQARYPDIFEAIANNDETAFKDFVARRNTSLLSIDSSNQTTAHAAARNGNVSFLKTILDKEPSLLKARDQYGYTVLHRAISRSDLDMVKCLVEDYEADIYQPVNYKWGNTALHLAAEVGRLDIVKYFVEERHVDPIVKNLKGQSAAFSAAVFKQLDVIKYFIEWQKVDVTQPDTQNDNIMFISVRMRDLRVPKYLLDDRRIPFDINWKGHLGRTLVYWAARVKRVHFMEYWVEEKKANINIADDNGQTPLHHAAQVGNLKIVKYLLRHKAKIEAEDVNGKKPVDLAIGADTIEYLNMKMRNRGRRSVIPQMIYPTIFLGSRNLIGNIGLDEPSDRANLPRLCNFLVIAEMLIKSVNATHYAALKHQSLRSPHEIIRYRMDPFLIEAIKSDFYQ